MTEPLLKIESLTKKYAENAKSNLANEVLKGVNLSVMPGEKIAIVGPSGCGKSTLLNIIGTLEVPTSGSLHFNSTDLLQISEKERANIRNRNIGIVFQDHHLLPQYTVLENILLPCLVLGVEHIQRAERLLERVGLTARKDAFPAEISGGERQRAAVIRALMNQPDLILADEPTGSLDVKHAMEVAHLLSDMSTEEGAALLLVTHSEQVAGIMGKTLRLDAGILEIKQ